MKAWKKRFVFLLALLTGVLLLAACSPAGGEGPDWDESILVYASLNPQGVDRAAVRRFNATHADIQIEVRDYTETGGQGGKHGAELLLTEIAAGQVPDIIDLGSEWGGAGQLPYRQLAQKGYLEDLWPYIENDPKLGREGVLEAPLKAAEVNGSLYMVFESVDVSTLVGAESLVGDRASWTLEELMETFASMPEDSTVLEYCLDKSSVLYYMIGMSLESYVDWESGECSFDSDRFRNALTFINENCPTTFDWSSKEEVNEEITQRRLEGRQMLSQELIYDPNRIRVLDAQFGGRAAFIGYPVEDGSIGSCFRPGNRKLAMSAVCRNKEAAWELIRQILLPKYSTAMGNNVEAPFGIPINRADYIWLKNQGREGYETTLFYHGPIVKLPETSQEDYRRFEDFFNSIDKIDMCDRNIYNIVYELSGAYFTGDKTLDETVDLIQRRVTLYVNESR